MKTLARWTVLSLAFFASGCVSLLPETAPPKPRYHIEAGDAAGLQGAPLSWSLVVDDPRSARVYDTVRIAVSTAPGKIEYFAGAEWADRGPRLFQTALLQTFENAGRIMAVGDRSAVPVADIVLQTDIRKMEMDVRGGAPRATVSIYARLNDGKGQIYAVRRFDAAVPASSQRADDVVAAFDGAFGSIIADLVAWTYDEGGAALAARSS